MTASLVLCSISSLSTADQPLALKPAASIEIPHSTGKFDFLRIDSKRHRLLAAHENDGTADYVDLQKNTPITRLKVGGAVDTAVDADSKFYYVSVQETIRVAVVDAATLQEVNSIMTAGPTDAILYEPKNHLIYVTHDEGADVWVIDPATVRIVATITIPRDPVIHG
jgi:DNA-binding beta-propeller fold protein YncE